MRLPGSILLAFALAVPAQAAELKVLSGNGARAAVVELAARFDKATGNKTTVEYFVSVVERLGIAAQMKPRMKPMPAEYNVEVVASGEADMVVVVASRISGVRGVQLVGGIPQELQTWIGFTGGVGAKAREPHAARAMLRFFTAAEAAAVLRATGIEPFVE
jgi:molybdate transport system substrate-binding protein